MKFLFSILAFLFFLSGVFAQSLYRFGGEIGVNDCFPNVKVEGQTMRVESVNGLYVRLIAEKTIVNRLWLSSGIAYVRSGFGGSYASFADKVLINNLHLPIWLRYEVSPERKKNKFFIQGGLYLNTAFRGVLRTQYSSETTTERLTFGNTPRKNFLRANDLGWGVGFGWNISNFILKFQYALSIRNLAPGGDKANMFKNRFTFISLGYTFAWKKPKKAPEKPEIKSDDEPSKE